QCQKRKRASRALENSTRDQSPNAARHVLQHQDRETSERNSGAKQKRQHVRSEKLLGVEKGSDQTERERGRPYDEGVPAEHLQVWALILKAFDHLCSSAFPPAPFAAWLSFSSPRLSSGTSESFAFWLNWSARM